MSDVWEAAYSVLNADPAADPDGDGENNHRECVAATNPLDAGSTLRMTSVQHLRGAYLVRWESAAGKWYQLEITTNLAAGNWMPTGPEVWGTGGLVLSAVPQTSPAPVAFRIRLITDHTAVSYARPHLWSVDTDLDGMPDLDEWAAGTDPFNGDSKFAITSHAVGDAVVLSWESVAGKRYQIQSAGVPASVVWIEEGGEIEGTGQVITSAIEVVGNARHFRLRVRDEDSDLDGVNDWEEEFTGLEFGPWHYRTNFPSDPAEVTAIVTATNIIRIESSVPVANATQQSPGGFLVTRSGNLNGLTVNYVVSGDAIGGTHYQSLSGSVFLSPGVMTADIPVKPLSETGLEPARSVALTLTPGTGYAIGSNAVARVNILREVPMVVTDFGAVGDSVTDDTLAIQAAITALEASTLHNSLHFPTGTYRLNTPTWITSTTESWYQLLELGKTDLASRDLLITADDGAELYSTTSPLRCRMLVARAKFRSLSFRNLSWRKDGNALSATIGEPNGADGVFLLYHDPRRVEALEFEGCRFDNCHRAITLSANSGFDTRGLLRRFTFRRCRVINPFGSNTLQAQLAFGGGQQIFLAPWVGLASYYDNVFDGGAEGPHDPVRNPLGIRKDGSHLGSPLQLIFTNNVVRRMGVEAIFQTDDPFMGTTAGSLVFPPADGTTSAQVLLFPALSSFSPGQIVNFRTPLTPTTQSKNALMTVVAYNQTNRVLTFSNPGLSPGVEGTLLPAERPIYLQDYNPTFATITGNAVVDGAGGGFIGIAANAKAVVRDNFIEGYSSSLYLYPNVRNPLNPPTPGTLLTSNVILTKDTTTGLTGYGVESFGPGEIIAGNLIVVPRSYRFVGATVRGTNGWMEANTVLPVEVIRNSYDTFARSVGIGFGNGSSNNTGVANSTYGMDVGIGPENPFQPAYHRVINHFSTNDVLPIDPIGLVP